MVRRLLFPLFSVALAAAAVASQVGGARDAAAGSGDGSNSTAVAHAASSTSLTARAVAAAQAFKASLSSSQQETLQYAFGDSKKASGWSNLPVGLASRNGVKVGDLTSEQQAKLQALLKTILSSRGYADEEATRKADAYLAAAQSSGTGGAQDMEYGDGLYYVAFFGTPSTSSKWTVQFGGHHLAIHMTFSGSAVSNTPYFVGVEPRTAFTVNGVTYQPMADEATYLYGAVKALTSTQKAKAKLSQSFDDVLLGPGQDGNFPSTAQGVTVSTLTASQRALVTKAIRAYLGDMPSTQATRLLKTYTSQYAKTKLAYAGTADGTTHGGYVRIQGPRLWLEIVTQNGIVLSGTHYHSIERDAKTDYGAGT